MASRADEGTHRVALVAIAVTAALWCAWLLWTLRLYMLDDALIHLQYARQLVRHGSLTFDGHTPSYGTSSPLFVLLLGAGELAFDAPMLPKALSVVAYVASLLVVGFATFRGGRGVRWLWGGLLFALMSPFGARWLTDGMETSLAVLVATLLAMRLPRSEPSSHRRWLVLAGLSAIAVALRIELAVLVGLGGGVACLLRLFREGARRGAIVRVALAESHAFIGAGAVLFAVWASMGALLPDTAIAKAQGSVDLSEAFVQVARVHGGAMSFGLLLPAVSLAAIVAASRGASLRTERALHVLAGSAVVVVITLALVRGQRLEGIRYLIAWYAFGIAWVASACGTSIAAPRIPAKIVGASMVLLALTWSLEAGVVGRVAASRGSTYAQFRDRDLSFLAGRNGLAFDIGFIAYFADAAICDGNGLVNGRKAAALPWEERLARCAAEKPVFAFLTPGQRRGSSPYLTMDDWVACGTFEFANVRKVEKHTLLVHPEYASDACAAYAADDRL